MEKYVLETVVTVTVVFSLSSFAAVTSDTS